MIMSKTILRRYMSTTTRNIRIYNSQTKTLEPLIVRDTRPISWYNCGPTVYDDAHLGHARTYVSMDMIRRILTDYFQVDVNYVMGVTDIDDKIVNRAKERNIRASELAARFEREFEKDMESLGVRAPTRLTRVSQYIPEILQFIETLEKNGYAYKSQDGVYFDVQKFGDISSCCYGAGLGPEDEIRRAAETEAPSNKRDARDFALWKCISNKEENEVWDSPYGKGRPGWHIECSAMTLASLGKRFDIHGGGIDLKFPHHTNEVAQSEAYLSTVDNNEKAWVKHWIHTGHLYISGLKMSKSLKNFITVRDLLSNPLPEGAPQSIPSMTNTNYVSLVFRVFCAQHHYRKNIHFSDDRLIEASKFLHRTLSVLRRIRSVSSSSSSSSERWSQENVDFNENVRDCVRNVRDAFANDFDTSVVLSEISSLISKIDNQITTTPKGLLRDCENAISRPLSVIGICVDDISHDDNDDDVFWNETRATESLVQFRAVIRDILREGGGVEIQDKLIQTCDELRDSILLPAGVETAVDTADSDRAMREKWENRIRTAVKKEQTTRQKKISFLESLERDFVEFDQDGVPLRHLDGELVSKSLRKKIKKKLKRRKRRS